MAKAIRKPSDIKNTVTLLTVLDAIIPQIKAPVMLASAIADCTGRVCQRMDCMNLMIEPISRPIATIM